MRQHFEIGNAAGVRLVRLVTADALKKIALEIELPRLVEALLRQGRMLLAGQRGTAARTARPSNVNRT
jgi:hypothetical protein